MKYKQLLQMLSMLLCLLLLTSCIAADKGSGSDLSSNQETTVNPVEELKKSDWKYRLYYTSNGDGTCYVSDILTNIYNTEDFTIEIPEKSPDGDIVVSIGNSESESEPNRFLSPHINILPKFITADEFHKLLRRARDHMSNLTVTVSDGTVPDDRGICIAKNTDRFPIGEVGKTYGYYELAAMNGFDIDGPMSLKYDCFEVKKFAAYFCLRDPSQTKDETDYNEVITEFPVTETVPIYDLTHLSSGVNAVAFFRCATTIRDYTGFTEADCLAEYDKLLGYRAALLKAGEKLEDTELYREIMSFSGHIKAISLPETVTLIGTGVFSGCTELESINFPGNLTVIGANAFESCTSLEQIVLPETLCSIGNYAFQDCRLLTEVTYPETAKISASAFDYCSESLKITLIPAAKTTEAPVTTAK